MSYILAGGRASSSRINILRRPSVIYFYCNICSLNVYDDHFKPFLWPAAAVAAVAALHESQSSRRDEQRDAGAMWVPRVLPFVCLSAERKSTDVAKYLSAPSPASRLSTTGTWLLCSFLYKWQLIKLLASFSPAEGSRAQIGQVCWVSRDMRGVSDLSDLLSAHLKYIGRKDSNLHTTLVVRNFSPRLVCWPRNELQLSHLDVPGPPKTMSTAGPEW